jgi:hypothetical protein
MQASDNGSDDFCAEFADKCHRNINGGGAFQQFPKLRFQRLTRLFAVQLDLYPPPPFPNSRMPRLGQNKLQKTLQKGAFLIFALRKTCNPPIIQPNHGVFEVLFDAH